MTALSLLNLCLYEYLRDYIGWYSIFSFVLFLTICIFMFNIGFGVIRKREIAENMARMAKARAAKKAKRETQESFIS